MKPSEGPCQIHDWPDEGLAARLIDEMRATHGRGGLTVCRDCILRARRVAEQKPAAP